MDNAASRAHALDLARPDGAAAAGGILVGDGAVQDVSDDLHVAMGMGRKPGAAPDPILIDHTQRPKAFMRRVIIIAEGEGMAGFQPIDLVVTAVFGFADGDHASVSIPKFAKCLT